MVLSAVCGPALAADIPPRPAPALPASEARQYDIVMEIGAGGAMKPAYEGSKDFEFNPTGLVTVHYLWLPGFGVLKNGRMNKEGFSFGPSVRYVSKRTSGDHAELIGLNDIDAAFELGGKFSYTFGMFRTWGAVRYGFGGYEGVVGEAGIELFMRPTAAMELTFGPRASFADGNYMRTYFGVTTAESARSGLAAYQPGGGVKGVGAELGIRYELNETWAVIGSATYEKLIGDAADSPIVKLGDANQFTAKLGLSYKFGLKLFD
jgi:outer membrane protein